MSTPTSYQRVGDTAVNPADYDWQTHPLYLRCDGTDDFMQTNSIDFTATDKMTVWAGVRKLSDAAAGVVSELSDSVSTNNGSFLTAYPRNNTVNVPNFAVKGTVESNLATTGNTLPSPISSILTFIAEISTDTNILRVNGVQLKSGTGDQGTGNFGNYPLYLFRRGGTTLPFNGRCYGIVVRGAQSSAAQISGGETYMNTRTKAF